MDGRGGTGIYVEIDPEPHERVFDDAMVLVHDVLRGDPVGPRLDRDRHSVLVGAADEQDVLAPHPLISHEYVCWHIDSGQMADVHGAVGVRQRACHKSSLEILLHKL